jgi:2-amino-4-ketopentanoate thiolase alpha subunit
MTDQGRCAIGDWVEVEFILLQPADRSKNLPPDTAEQPLRVWVKGFAQAEAALGDEVTLETMTGRTVTGRLSDINPGYFHTFGRPIPELVHVGRDLRARLAGYRAAEAGRAASPGWRKGGV